MRACVRLSVCLRVCLHVCLRVCVRLRLRLRVRLRVCLRVSVCVLFVCVWVYLDVSVLLTLETNKLCFDVFLRFTYIYANCNKPQRSV